jgi:putative copper resistance protein D
MIMPMRLSQRWGWSLVCLCLVVLMPYPLLTHAQELPFPSETQSPANDNQTIDLRAPSHHHSGHHHRPPLLSPEEDKAYSELNHHIAGVFVLLAGGLALIAQHRPTHHTWAQTSWPVVFVLLGVFLFIRHDPESWPLGPLSFQESVTDVQVLQHFIFTVIVVLMGTVEWLRTQGKVTHGLWGLLFPALAVSAALMLFAHPHGEGPTAEKIYRHHAIMAVAGIAAMIVKVLDDTQLFRSKIGGYLWCGLIMFVGVMLLLYTE